MRSADWALAVAAAAAAAVLVNAGAAKLVSPGQLRLAVAELWSPSGRQLPAALVRGFGAAEFAAGAGLLIAPARLAAAIVTAVLGACFATLGVFGLARGSSVSCGCFGAAGVRSLGWTNIGLGAGLALAWPAVVLAGQVPAVSYSQAAVLFATIGVVLLCLWLNRDLVMRLRGATRAQPASSEVR